jgi:hypothetical protein
MVSSFVNKDQIIGQEGTCNSREITFNPTKKGLNVPCGTEYTTICGPESRSVMECIVRVLGRMDAPLGAGSIFF